MEIEVLLFASLRDRAGAPSVRVHLDGDLTVGALRLALSSAHPELRAGLSSSRVAVDREFREDEHPLVAGVEVAIIPPVSGG